MPHKVRCLARPRGHSEGIILVSEEPDHIIVVETNQPGAVIGGFVRPLLFVSSELQTDARKKIVQEATLRALSETESS